MSEVFLAKTEGLEGFERKVALKRIFPSLSENDEFVRSFVAEARIGGMLYHHNVVQTLDFGKGDDDTYFIALEYIEGTHLGDVLKACRDTGQALPHGVFLQIAIQICEGLEYIHHAEAEQTELNLVHRDIKPSNMLITAQGVIKISDFGVVKAERIAEQGTAVGAVKGTIGYMSPEQARGESVGPTSDLFSLGAMLFEMATLTRLYGDGDQLDILERVKESDFRVPIEQAGAYISGLERVLKRMLRSNPRDRYQEAAQVFAALRALPVSIAARSEVAQLVRSMGLAPSSRTEAESGPASIGPGRDVLGPPRSRVASKRGPSWWQVFFGELNGPGLALYVALLVVVGLASAVGSYYLVHASLTPPPPARPIPLAQPLGPLTGRGEPIQLVIQTVPAGAVVKVDGVPFSPTTPVRIQAFPDQKVVIEKRGYARWEQSVDRPTGRPAQEWIVRLQPTPLGSRQSTGTRP